MTSILRPLLALVALLGLGPLASAQGLVQLRFSGELDVERGHLIEVELGEGGSERELVLHVHLASGTTGPEVAQLVARRAERAGIAVTLTESRKGAASVWIDAASYVNVRMGGGLHAEVACAEAAPSLLRVLPPTAIPEAGHVHIVGSAAVVSQGRPPIRTRAELRAEVTPKMDAPAAATALWKAGADKWMSERPGSDAWRPIRLLDGGVLTGASVRAEGSGDWRLEVSLD